MHLLIDVNECLNTSSCDHNCTNEIGSFTCSCTVGYRLGNDGKRCTGTEFIYFIVKPVNVFFIISSNIYIYMYFLKDYINSHSK